MSEGDEPAKSEDPELLGQQKAAEKIERDRERLVRRLSAAAPQTVRERVAWVLNFFPQARNSDVELCIEYWKKFNAEFIANERVRLRDMYKMARVPAIVRERQRIQNDFRLFLATPAVRARRGTLSEEEKQQAVDAQEPPPPYSVYADESGKGGDFLVVGAVWFFDAFQLLRVTHQIEQLLLEQGFSSELHFKEIDHRNLELYIGVAELLLAIGSTMSFTSVSVERRGVGRIDDALEELWFHLLIAGIEHHHASGRANLPRSLNFVKDEEEPGRDRILVANLRERLRQASETRLGKRLAIDRMHSLDSKGNVPLQIADLFTSSLGRRLNATGRRDHPKDTFADHLLDRLGVGDGKSDQVGDVAVHLRL